MTTQIIKKAAVKEREFKVGENIDFRCKVPEQNIGWNYKRVSGVIQKVNKVTVHVLDEENNLWKVEKYDVL